MAKYKLTENGVFDTENNLSIPNAPDNRHWREYQEWAAAGNVPDPIETVGEAKARRKTQLNEEREAALVSGVAYNGYTFDTDERSRSNVVGTVGAINAGIPLPTGFTWRTSDNQDVPMTEAQMVELAGLLLEHVNTTYAKSWQLKAQVDDAASIDEVDAVVWT